MGLSSAIKFDYNTDKTAGYNRHILPLAILVKMPFRKKAFFFQNTLRFFIIIPNFFTFKNFLISSRKHLTNKVERHF